MPKKTTKTAYLYARLSTPEQMEGDGERRQTERAQSWCERNEVKLDDTLTYRDLGVSGRHGKNLTKGKLGAFLRAVEDGRIRKGSILICESLDRLARTEIDNAFELWRRILLAGIEIVTTMPERLYTTASLNETMARIEVQFIADRAHQESALKGQRVGDAWAEKKSKASEEKLTAQCPNWLKLSADRKTFDPIPEAVQAIKKIFTWCAEGLGTAAITKRLHAEQIKPIGRAKTKRAKTWHKSYVTKILNNRAVVGEYQPHIGHAGPDRRPIGEPVPNYYPAIVTEAAFYKAQAALQSRKLQRGPTGKQVANLFTGVVQSADGSAMHLVDKGKRSSGPQLVSYDAQRGVEGSRYITFPYRAFERSLLHFASELKPSDLVAAQPEANDVQDRLAEEEGQLAKLEAKRDKVKKRLLVDEDFDSLLDVLKTLEDEIAATHSRIEKLKGEMHHSADASLSEAKSLIGLLSETSGDALTELRTRIKAKLRAVIAKIYIYITKIGSDRFAMCQVHFRSGGIRLVCISTKTEGFFALGTLERVGSVANDIRDKKTWSKLEKIVAEVV